MQRIIEGIEAVVGCVNADSEAFVFWDEYERRLRDDLGCPLAELAARHALSSFELRTLLLAVAREVEPCDFELTARFALATLARTTAERIVARRALLPQGALVAAGLLNIADAPCQADRKLAVSGPALRFLLREDSVPAKARIERPSETLLDVILPADALDHLRRLAERHFELDADDALTILLSGPSGTGKTRAARAVANHLGRPLLTVAAGDLPTDDTRSAVVADLLCDARLRDAVLLVDDCHRTAMTPLLEAVDRGFDGLVLLTTAEPSRLDDTVRRRIAHHLAVNAPDAEARRQLFEVHLPADVAVADDLDLDALAGRYELTGAAIRNAVAHARRLTTTRRPALTMAQLEAGCRAQLAKGDGALTVRGASRHRLEDIVLPERADATVRELIAACRNQSTVLGQWGFGRRLATGKGLVALFDGPPGTGKTFCAEILAGELGRPLHRVNIAEVVSKWAGETEKQIQRIFQQARAAHAVLLFDEADSLFSQRVAETKSSADRHSNMEVNLLLQEIERFSGVCILTTNFFGALDSALVRRIQFRVTFEEPGRQERAAIWRKLCPTEAPLADDVSFDDLAHDFEMTGAMIKNALLRAAYRACEAGAAIGMDDLVVSCRDEGIAAGRVVRIFTRAA